jgi:hypothetical protein
MVDGGARNLGIDALGLVLAAVLFARENSSAERRIEKRKQVVPSEASFPRVHLHLRRLFRVSFVVFEQLFLDRPARSLTVPVGSSSSADQRCADRVRGPRGVRQRKGPENVDS